MDEIERMLQEKAQQVAMDKFRALPVMRCSKGNVAFINASINKITGIEKALPIDQPVLFCMKCNKLHPWCAQIGNIPADQISTCEMKEYKDPNLKVLAPN
jgi:hypothetical protein